MAPQQPTILVVASPHRRADEQIDLLAAVEIDGWLGLRSSRTMNDDADG
jgi:hypothetical protein